MSGDTHDLARFVEAQAAVIDHVRDELRTGRKRTHWMWFMFPQIEGLGSSATARHYAIRSLEEARAYLAHPILGTRLEECVDLVLAGGTSDAHAIFGSPDDMKFRSSLTLFVEAGGGQRFREALDRFFHGKPDDATLRRLR